MVKKIYLFLVAIFAVLLFSCIKDMNDDSGASFTNKRIQFSVEEARQFFESSLSNTTTRTGTRDNTTSFFVAGDAIPDWNAAEVSSSSLLGSVDIPLAAQQYKYVVTRTGDDGVSFTTTAYYNLLVVKSAETGEMTSYLHFFLPDRLYAEWYDGDLSQMFPNSEPRGDYSGLELYATADWQIAAIAHYENGNLLDRVFVGDFTMSLRMKNSISARLLNGVLIEKYKRRVQTAITRSGDDMDYEGSIIFLDQFGNIHVQVDYDGDGRYESVTLYEWYDEIMGNRGGSGGAGGGTGGSTGGGSGGGDFGGTIGVIGGGGGFGTGDDNPVTPPEKVVNPIDRVPVGDTPEEMPCRDDEAQEANPLLDMAISPDNGYWKKNTWGVCQSSWN